MRTFLALLAALAACLVAWLWLAAPAGAVPPSLHVAPSTAPAGSSVLVSGTCEANTSGFAISHAFLHDATHEFAGVGAAPFTTDAAGRFSVTAQIPSSIPPGSYEVTARCGGGNLGILVKLTVVAASGPPTAVPAGSGGQAAPAQSHTPWLLTGVGGTLLAVGCAGLTRRRVTR